MNSIRNFLTKFGALSCLVGALACLGCSSKSQSESDVAGDIGLADADVAPDAVVDQGPTSISEGVGIGMRSETLLLGDSLAQIQSKLGPPTALRDMGAAGTEFEYQTAHVGGLLSGSGDSATVVAIYLFDGFQGKTTKGLGLGSSKAEWEAAYGAGVVTPFSGAVQYGDVGLIAEFSQDSVVRIHLVKSAKDVALCPPQGPFGTENGERLANLSWTDTDGNSISLHGQCGTRLLLAYHFYGW